METGYYDAKARPDRFSTCEEIRAALSFLPDTYVEGGKHRLWEVASDLGGHVLVEIDTDETLTLLEKLDAVVN